MLLPCWIEHHAVDMCALRFLVLTLTLVIITSSQPTEVNNGQCPTSDMAIHEMTEENRQLRHEVQKISAKLATIAMDIKKILQGAQGAKNSTIVCPSEFLHRNEELKSCYFFSKTKMTWENAKDDCSRRGAYLVEVQSKEEDDFLRVILMTGGEINHWMGGNDLLKEGQWVWQQSGKIVIYTNWKSGEPGNSYGGEDCLMYWTNNAQWNDARCSNVHLYICEKSHT